MKMNIENRARLAFVLLLLIGVAIVLGWYFIRSTRHATYEIRTQDAISGLLIDAPVEFHGVEVGKVKRVELLDARTVSILLSVDKKAPVTTATVATITARGLATRGFTGYVYVALEDAASDARPLLAAPGSPYPIIASAPSRSVSLDLAVSQVTQNVQFLTELAQSVLDPQTITALKQSVDGLQRVTQTLATNNAKLAAIIANAERASTQVEPLLQSSNEAIGALQSQILPQAYASLAKLDALSTSLADVAARIKRDPSVVVRGSTARPGPGEGR